MIILSQKTFQSRLSDSNVQMRINDDNSRGFLCEN